MIDDFSTVYVLECEDNAFYVGYTRNLNLRLMEHFTGIFTANWCQLHKPIGLKEVVLGGKDKENEVVLNYMWKYGWENVRGGSWCKLEYKSCPKRIEQALGIHGAIKNILLD